ncbi:rolling circle replication-associated protein [Nocardioides korecus]
MGTLTYAGEGLHDPQLLRVRVGLFFRTLRRFLDVGPFPYVWVPEWHKTGHGLHVHFAVGHYIPRGQIEAAWPHGFVHIKRLTDLPVGSTALHEGRKAAGYLSKYVTKSFADQAVERQAGLHRYEVAEGFQPPAVRLTDVSSDDVLDQAVIAMGGLLPAVLWSSDEVEGWQGPPAVWAAWD